MSETQLPKSKYQFEVFSKDGKFALQVTCDSRFEIDITLDARGDVSAEYLFHWLLYNSRNLFFHRLPIVATTGTDGTTTIPFSFSISKDLGDIDLVKRVVLKYFEVVHRTNALMCQIAHLKNAAAAHNTLLVYNVDRTQSLKELFERYQLQGHSVLYQDLLTGWNPSKREYEAATFFAPEELLNFIFENKIKTIFSLNHYYSSYMHDKYSIQILAVLNFIGAELVYYDLDTYESVPHGEMSKSSENYPGFRRFSAMPNVCLWDKAFGNDNITPVPILIPIAAKKDSVPLDDDFEILVASNSRVKDTAPFLQSCLFILETCRDDHVFYDFQMIHYAMRSLLSDSPLPLTTRLAIDSRISHFHICVMSLLKMEILSKLQTSHKIRLYGDEGWNVVCPEHFQNKYLPNKECYELMATGKYLRLLFNQNFSYAENNPVHIEAIRNGHPFLCYPSLAATEEFAPLQGLEYKNLTELSQKIEDAPKLLRSEKINSAFSAVANTYNTSLTELFDFLIKPKKDLVFHGHFYAQHQAHKKIFSTSLTDFFKNKPKHFDALVAHIFENKPFAIPPSECRYADRGYIKNLLHYQINQKR